jgi:multidrug efflux pump subunit AcrB
MMIAFLVVFGLFSYTRLGLDVFPKVDFPTVTVTTNLKGASPEEIETQVTKPIEEVVNTISGIDELRSTTVEGVSHVLVTFLLEKDIDVAAQEVREKVSTILSQFPKDTDPPIIQKMDPDAAPVMAIVVSGKRSPREMTEIAKKRIKEPLETVNGVGSITMVGGREREIQVTVDVNRLNAYELGIDQVARAIRAQNVEVPGGRITHGEREMVLRTMGRLGSVEEFNDVIVANVNGVPIKVSDIGKVEDTFEEPRSISRLDGENAVSLLVAFTLVPMLGSRFLKMGGHKVSKESRFYAVIDRIYGVMLNWSLRHRIVMAMVSIAVFSTIFYIFPRVGKELVIDDDQSEYEIVVETPEGSSLEKTERILRGIEDEVRKLPGVAHVFTTIGAGETASVTNASIYVAMVPIKERGSSQNDSMTEARRLLRKYPELRVSVQNVGMISGGGFKQTPVNLVLRGPELSQLDVYSREIVDYARGVPGLVDVDTSIALRKPEARVEIDRERASELGVTIDSLSSSLRAMVGGEEVTKFKDGDEQYPVTLRLMEDYRKDPSVISGLTVSSLKGVPVRLDNFVRLTEEKSPAQIDRQDREKQVTIMANLEGMALGEAVAKLQKKIDSMNLPQEYTTVFIGRAKTMNQAILGFTIAAVLSIVFIYMVLASQFNSFVHPFAIMACIPLSLPFGLLSLLVTGKTLNVYSMIGVLMLFGIIKKNSILQVDYTNTLRGEGIPREEAIVRANHVRLRPILMTTICIIFGMLPIALGRGDGAASRASMAMVMVGGQALSLLITLLITPVVYSLLDDLRNVFKRQNKLTTRRAQRNLCSENTL